MLGKPITITDPQMTRFMMTLNDAVDLVVYAFEHGENGDLLIMKAPACSIGLQAEAVCEMFGGNKAKSAASIKKANATKINIAAAGSGIGYGGHFRAVQGFKYIGIKEN